MLFGHPRAEKIHIVKLKNNVGLHTEWNSVNHAPRQEESKPHVCLDTGRALCMETTLLMVLFVWLRYSGPDQETLKTQQSLSTSHGTATPCCPIARDMGQEGSGASTPPTSAYFKPYGQVSSPPIPLPEQTSDLFYKGPGSLKCCRKGVEESL